MSIRDLEVMGVLGAAFFLAACGEYSYEDRSHGRGPVREQAVEVGTFSAVDMRGDGRVEIRVGEPASLVMEGRESLLERTEVEVRGDTLHISTRGRKRWFWGDGRQQLEVRIGVPQLDSLRLRGGNDVRLEGFQGGETTIHVEGAAHIQASGRLQKLTVRMSGAGHADLDELVADQAQVTVDGIGSVFVNAKESLDATMNGLGTIMYSGNPGNVQTRMNGLGSISHRDSDEQRREQRKDRHDSDETQPAGTEVEVI